MLTKRIYVKTDIPNKLSNLTSIKSKLNHWGIFENYVYFKWKRNDLCIILLQKNKRKERIILLQNTYFAEFFFFFFFSKYSDTIL